MVYTISEYGLRLKTQMWEIAVPAATFSCVKHWLVYHKQVYFITFGMHIWIVALQQNVYDQWYISTPCLMNHGRAHSHSGRTFLDQ